MLEKVLYLIILPVCTSILVIGLGKTVSNAFGTCLHKSQTLLLVDLPGTYSLMSNSVEEEIARDYICFGNSDCTIVVVDATCLERNLNLVFQTMEITSHVIVCVNLLDEAKKKGIFIDLKKLEFLLGVPVVGTVARKKKTLSKLLDTVCDVCSHKIRPTPKTVIYVPIIEDIILKMRNVIPSILPIDSRWLALKLLDYNEKIISAVEKHFSVSLNKEEFQKTRLESIEILGQNSILPSELKDKIVSSIMFHAENICKDVIHYSKNNYSQSDRKIDKILTSKMFGFPIMLLLLAVVFWLTITGANYPSQFLSSIFGIIEEKLLWLFNYIHAPSWLTGILVSGMYKTLAWVVAVMLPPMAIFFPLFTILEDSGYLPRIAFNLDNFFRKCCTTGKQALTMCMGFGCNAAGVIGCRIINSPRERLIAILTNTFIPCNGRFPFLITIASIFFGSLFVRY